MKRDYGERECQKSSTERKILSGKREVITIAPITTSKKLREELAKIDSENITATKKRSKKSALSKTQVQIRRKILHQCVPIVFTYNRK